MQLDSAFPRLLDRQYAVVKPEYPLITILYLLKVQEMAAVPLTSGNRSEKRVVFGFSSLEKFVKLGPKRFAALLRGPCYMAAEELGCLTTDQDLRELLDSFKAHRVGFAVVRGTAPYSKRALVTLGDVLTLYGRGAIRTDMKVEDVASPIFSMSGRSSIREALQAMFDRGYRRIFISKDGYYISDRSIINYIMNPTALVGLDEEPPVEHLDVAIRKLAVTSPVPVSAGVGLKEAAAKLLEHRGECLVMNGDSVVTPWDLVMKPWLARRLVIDDSKTTPQERKLARSAR